MRCKHCRKDIFIEYGYIYDVYKHTVTRSCYCSPDSSNQEIAEPLKTTKLKRKCVKDN